MSQMGDGRDGLIGGGDFGGFGGFAYLLFFVCWIGGDVIKIDGPATRNFLFIVVLLRLCTRVGRQAVCDVV